MSTPPSHGHRVAVLALGLASTLMSQVVGQLAAQLGRQQQRQLDRESGEKAALVMLQAGGLFDIIMHAL